MNHKLARILGFDTPDALAHESLAHLLHARPLGLALGAASGVGAGSAAIVAGNNEWLLVGGAAMSAIAVIRAFAAYFARGSGRFAHASRAGFAIGAFCFGLATGSTAALALLLSVQPHLQVLLVGYALIFGAGTAVGNAVRPGLALGQMLSTFVPVIGACLIIGTLPLLVLAAILPALAVGLSYVTMDSFVNLSSQVGVARDSEALAAQMREQARTDMVTGLANRAGLEAEAREMLRPGGLASSFALLWLDLHRFKDVNDTLGHEAGDRVLSEVAARLRALVPAGTPLARFGSDEFVILLGVESRVATERLCATIRTDLARSLRIAGHRIETGCSIGVALTGPEADGFEQLMQQADLALYHAKTAGRQQVCFFDPSMTRNLVRRKEIEADLRAAIQRDELSIYFQPIIDLATGRIRAFEALVRWFHPDKGELVPDEFIPVAEETGLIITLGNWITRRAARTAATWPADITLAVNLSPMQIRAPGAALGILAALREAGLDPARLELEVTENLFVENVGETGRFMDELAAHGVCFALDDFGTGYSSLHYINRYPFRTIKVDRSFVSGPLVDRRSDAIIRAVAEMGAMLGMEIVAEGLETGEQVEAVRRAGCTLGQGYYFSRAVPDHLAARLIEDERETPTKAQLAG